MDRKTLYQIAKVSGLNLSGDHLVDDSGNRVSPEELEATPYIANSSYSPSVLAQNINSESVRQYSK